MIDVDAKKITQLILKEDELLENNGEKDINEIEENLKNSQASSGIKLAKTSLQRKQNISVGMLVTEV